ncbi:MAG: hypothetical protein J6Y21_00095 [Clostridia bacterium]|nr:hypothetical protein [Clostridia bacterium]
MAEQLKMIRTSAPVKEIPLPEGYSYESFEGGIDQISPIGNKYQTVFKRINIIQHYGNITRE